MLDLPCSLNSELYYDYGITWKLIRHPSWDFFVQVNSSGRGVPPPPSISRLQLLCQCFLSMQWEDRTDTTQHKYMKDLYIECARRQSHVTASLNVNKRWSTREANGKVNAKVRHFLLLRHFGISAHCAANELTLRSRCSHSVLTMWSQRAHNVFTMCPQCAHNALTMSTMFSQFSHNWCTMCSQRAYNGLTTCSHHVLNVFTKCS